ncbi:HMA2 domain-containing protein [Treponema sp. C6A8]|uniref:HMA2 domain-containing protein n=1 Tax=Treponema sp. C6A8 TaxID=1410609 RepID=UPI000A7C0D6B|nr:hypothetical protein [Treponema sp. C6A8]
MMVTSFFPGRIRLRAPVFKEADLVEKAIGILRKFPALKNVENNLLTGSVLIEYEADKVPMEKLISLRDFFMELAKEAERFDGSNRDKIIEMLEKLNQLI